MEQHTYILDRIEGEAALLIAQESGRIIEIPAALLPCGCREGSVLHRSDAGWKCDLAAELLRRETIEEKLRKLLEKNK